MAGLETLLQLLSGGPPMPAPGFAPPQSTLSDAGLLQTLLGPAASTGATVPPPLVSSPGVPRIPGAAPAPTVRPRITNNRAAELEPGFDTSAPEPAKPRLFDGAGDFVTDVAAGVPYDPASPLASFAAGVTGAGQSAAGRAASKRKTAFEDEDRAIAADDRAYTRKRNARTDARADAAAGRAGAASSRAARQADLNALLTKARIAEIQRKGGLGKMTGRDLIAIERLAVGDYAKSLGLTTTATMSPTRRAEALAKVETYRKDLQERFRATLADGGSGDDGSDDMDAPDAEDPIDVQGMAIGDGADEDAPAAAAPRLTSGSMTGGDGSSAQSPVKLAPGDRAAFQSLPSGAYIQDDSGAIFRKK